MEIYSFDNVTMLVNERPITGYAEGSTIKIEDNEDSILPKVGLDGAVSYANNSNRSAKITFSLAQDSASLPRLRQLLQSHTTFAVVVRDATPGSGFMLQAENCAILKMPPIERGKEISSGEVIIYVPRADLQ